MKSTAGFARLRRGLLDHLASMSDAEAKLFMYAVLRARNVGQKAGQFAGTFRDIAVDLGWSRTKLSRVVEGMSRYLVVETAPNQHAQSTFTVVKFSTSAVTPEGQQRDSTGTAPGQHKQKTGQQRDSTGTAGAKNVTAPPRNRSKQETSGPGIRVDTVDTVDTEGDGGKNARAYGEFGNVVLSDHEREKLIGRLGADLAETYIEALDTYIEQDPTDKKRRKYKAYPTILNWHRRDKAEGRNRMPKQGAHDGRTKQQQRAEADDAAFLQALAEECDDSDGPSWLSEDLPDLRRDDGPRSSQTLLPIVGGSR